MGVMGGRAPGGATGRLGGRHGEVRQQLGVAVCSSVMLRGVGGSSGMRGLCALRVRGCRTLDVCAALMVTCWVCYGECL